MNQIVNIDMKQSFYKQQQNLRRLLCTLVNNNLENQQFTDMVTLKVNHFVNGFE